MNTGRPCSVYQQSVYLCSDRRDSTFFVKSVSQHQQTRCLGDTWNGFHWNVRPAKLLKLSRLQREIIDWIPRLFLIQSVHISMLAYLNVVSKVRSKQYGLDFCDVTSWTLGRFFWNGHNPKQDTTLDSLDYERLYLWEYHRLQSSNILYPCACMLLNFSERLTTGPTTTQLWFQY